MLDDLDGPIIITKILQRKIGSKEKSKDKVWSLSNFKEFREWTEEENTQNKSM